MSTCSSKPTPYNYKTNLYEPVPENAPITHVTKPYQQLLGEIRYIADSKRQCMYFVADRSSVAAKNPTKRYWNALKRLIQYMKRTRTPRLILAAGLRQIQKNCIPNFLRNVVPPR